MCRVSSNGFVVYTRILRGSAVRPLMFLSKILLICFGSLVLGGVCESCQLCLSHIISCTISTFPFNMKFCILLKKNMDTCYFPKENNACTCARVCVCVCVCVCVYMALNHSSGIQRPILSCMCVGDEDEPEFRLL
jgi:hypothetical protein